MRVEPLNFFAGGVLPSDSFDFCSMHAFRDLVPACAEQRRIQMRVESTEMSSMADHIQLSPLAFRNEESCFN